MGRSAGPRSERRCRGPAHRAHRSQRAKFSHRGPRLQARDGNLSPRDGRSIRCARDPQPRSLYGRKSGTQPRWRPLHAVLLERGFPAAGNKKSSRRSGKKKSPENYLLPEGFVQMLLPDAQRFDRETYEFEYVRREFLGDVRCLVFDVRPRPDNESGRFLGRIWVEDQRYHIVRFNGTYTLSEAAALFFHFDSWRTNVAPGVWVPSFVYVEDTGKIGPLGQEIRFKGQSRVWGYQAFKNSKLQELTEILVTSEQPVEDETGAKDVTPLESHRSWTRQAEENVMHRLERSGLMAPRSDVGSILNTVVRNLAATNDIALEIECRVLLTTPLETFSIGQSIVISRGLIDVLPDEASLAMVLADELAHIALGIRPRLCMPSAISPWFPTRNYSAVYVWSAARRRWTRPGKGGRNPVEVALQRKTGQCQTLPQSTRRTRAGAAESHPGQLGQSAHRRGSPAASERTGRRDARTRRGQDRTNRGLAPGLAGPSRSLDQQTPADQDQARGAGLGTRQNAV